MRRRALVVGIEGPAADPADDTPPQWQPLTYAAPKAQRVAEALEKEYAYVLLEPGHDPATTAAALGDALTQAISSQADFTVSFISSHTENRPATVTVSRRWAGTAASLRSWPVGSIWRSTRRRTAGAIRPFC